MTIIGLANGLSLPSAVAGAISVSREIAGAAAGLSRCCADRERRPSAIAGAALAGGTPRVPMFALMIGAALAVLSAIGIFRRNRS